MTRVVVASSTDTVFEFRALVLLGTAFVLALWIVPETRGRSL
jgi:hypothetical protein